MNWAWLNTEYPFEQTTREKRNFILSISVIASLIVLFLQPFGFSIVAQIFHFSGFLIIAVITLGINYIGFPYFFPKHFEESRWSITKAFFFLLYNCIIIGFWNHILSALFMKGNAFFLPVGSDLIAMLFRTLAVGIVASFFSILIKYNFLARKHLQISQDINDEFTKQLETRQVSDDTEYITLTLENKEVSIKRNDLTYVSAEGNYITLHNRSKEVITPKLYRATIKQIDASLQGFPEFFRCHRSYIINLNAIESSIGNSQGLFIKMNQEDLKIPVARPNIKSLRNHLNKNNISKQFITLSGNP